MGLELGSKSEKNDVFHFEVNKSLGENFLMALCDKNSSNGASFFDSIWELRPVGTSTFNGKLQLALTHRIYSQECVGFVDKSPIGVDYDQENKPFSSSE